MKLQISAAHGPGECERAAALALQRLSAEAAAHGIRVEIHDERRSRRGIQSAVITLSGDGVAAFAARWQGTIQWIWQSRLRPRHPRKNWYIGIYPLAEAAPVARGDIHIQSCKAGGKGGQHVNKTRSAVCVGDGQRERPARQSAGGTLAACESPPRLPTTGCAPRCAGGGTGSRAATRATLPPFPD